MPIISVLDSVPGLRLADRDWRALAAMRSPVRVALWLALLKTSEELMARESLTERLVSTVDTDQPPPEEGYPPETSSIPAVVAWAEAAVRRGIRGDMQAWSLVADRIEGKVATRQGDIDPEDERRRGDMQSVIESVIGAMTTERLNSQNDEPLDITPHEVVDVERQDSDAIRRQELRESQEREAQDNQGRGESLAQTNQEPEERDLSDPLEGPRIVTSRNGSGNGHA